MSGFNLGAELRKEKRLLDLEENLKDQQRQVAEAWAAMNEITRFLRKFPNVQFNMRHDIAPTSLIEYAHRILDRLAAAVNYKFGEIAKAIELIEQDRAHEAAFLLKNYMNLRRPSKDLTAFIQTIRERVRDEKVSG